MRKADTAVERGFTRALQLRRAGKFADAVSALDALCSRQPSRPDLLLHRGLTLSALGQQESALRDMEQAVTLEETPLLKSFYTLVLFDAGRLDDAEAILRRVLQNHPEEGLAQAAGLLLSLQRENYPAAREHLQKYGFPETPHFTLRFCFLLEHWFLSQPPVCPAGFAADIETLLTRSAPAEKKPSRLFSEGVDLYTHFNIAEAARVFARGLAAGRSQKNKTVGLFRKLLADGVGTETEFSTALGECLTQLGLATQARPLFDFSMKNDPDDPWTRFYFGKHLVATGEIDSGEKILLELLRDNSNFVECRRELGVARMKTGDVKTAREYFAASIDTDLETFPRLTRHYLKTAVGVERPDKLL